jgi:hypothetical protein
MIQLARSTYTSVAQATRMQEHRLVRKILTCRYSVPRQTIPDWDTCHGSRIGGSLKQSGTWDMNTLPSSAIATPIVDVVKTVVTCIRALREWGISFF